MADIGTQENIMNIRTKLYSVPGVYSRDIGNIAISPDDRLLARFADRDKVQISNINTGQIIQSFVLDANMGPGSSANIKFSPDGRKLAIIIQNSILQIIELYKGTTIWEYKLRARGLSLPVLNYAFSPDSRTLAISDGRSITTQ